MSHAAAILELLDSPDPDVRAQAVELARAVGPAAIAALLSACTITTDGLLRCPGGLTEELLTLLLDSRAPALSQIRRLVLAGRFSEPLIARLAELPALADLTLSRIPVEDPKLFRGFTGLTRLAIEGTSLDLTLIHRLPALRHLSLAGCRSHDLGALQSMSLTSLSLHRTDAPSTTLPETLTALNLLDYQGRVPNLTRLSLRSLSISAEALTDRSWAADIQHLSLNRCEDPGWFSGLPVEHLDHAGGLLSDLTPLCALPCLQSVTLPRLDDARALQGLRALAAHPTLTVVDVHDHAEWSRAWPARWVSPPEQLRRALLFPHIFRDTHPMGQAEVVARTAAHWRHHGHRFQLCTSQPIPHKIRAIKQLRQHTALGLRATKDIFDGLMGGGLPCLTLDEAILRQGWLRGAGFATRISPWSPTASG